jgi:hypothetical protein
MPKSVHIVGSKGIVLELDSITPGDVQQGRMVIIDGEQHDVNVGRRFSVYDYDGDVDDTKYWHLKTPIAPSLEHIRLNVTASKSGLLEVFRDATIISDGDELEPINENQCLGDSCDIGVFRDPSVSDDGFRTAVFVIGSDSPAVVGGTGGTVERERTTILKQNSSYLAKFTAQDTDTRVSFELHFVEIGGN